MDEKRLKDVLAESEAEFVQAEVWTTSPVGNFFTRRWEIDRSDAADAEQFLKLYTSADNWKGNPADRFYSIINPWASTRREGLYRGGRVSAKVEVDPADQSEIWYVYQELREGLAQTVKDSAGDFDFSGFVLGNVKQFIHGGSANLLLRLPNVDPAKQQAIVAELEAQETFTDIEAKYDTYADEWRGVYADSKSEEDGSVSILLYLTNSVNQDYYFWIMSGATTVEGHYLKFGTNEALIQSFLSTVYFKADGQLDTDDPVAATSKTLQESQPGRSVPARVTLDSDTRLLNVEFVITWQIGNQIADTATASAEARVFTDPAVSVPRQGTSTVSQWWERGENTADLPDKPANLYDSTNGTWSEEYIMQSPPDILPNGRYNWLMACKRVALPAAMLYPTDYSVVAIRGLPRWIPQAKQSKTNKELNTISISGQQVMRLMNGLLDNPQDYALNGSIEWNTPWDWTAGTYVIDFIVYHDNTWWKAQRETAVEPSESAASDWLGTTEAPAGWSTELYGAWQSNYGKTFLDAFTSAASGPAWQAAWDNDAYADTNSDATWTNRFASAEWLNILIPSSEADPFEIAPMSGTGSTIAYKTPLISDGTLRDLGTVFFSNEFRNPDYESDVFLNGGVLHNAEGTFNQHFGEYIGIGNVFHFITEADSSATCPAGEHVAFIVHKHSEYVHSGYTKVTYPMECISGHGYSSYYTTENVRVSVPDRYDFIARSSRIAVVGDMDIAGELVYENGINGDSLVLGAIASTDGGPAGIASDYGYPFRRSILTPITIYVRDKDLEPTDGGTTVLPRFGFTADRYSNPNLLEVFRRTRQKIDTEVFRKYCAVHPALLDSLSAYIPAAFTDSDGLTFPSDSYWTDSNTLIKFRISDGPVQMSGAPFFYVELMIEHYGEKEADVQEVSARDGSQRNAAVDPDTGLGMVYSKPQELTANYAPEKVSDGSTRREATGYGLTSEMINPFEIRTTT